MKLTFMPNTKQGKLSVVFIIIAIVIVFLINIIAISFGFPEKGLPSFNMSILLGIMTFGALTSVIISTINGLKAIIKDKERSVLVYICILIDIVAIYFAIAEIIGFITGSPD